MRKFLVGVGGVVACGGSGVAYIAWDRRVQTSLLEPLPHGTPPRPRVVVLGSGWGSMSLLSTIDTELYDVTVISPRNYFIMTPFLPCATVGTVENRHVIEPIRRFFARSHKRAKFHEASCENIDVKGKEILCRSVGAAGEGTFKVPYDQLVVAVGADNNTFNTPGVKEHAYFLKSLEDSIKIRKRVIHLLEQANLPTVTPEDRSKLLHFVVVGGGPTGVEFAAELHDFVHQDVKKYFPELLPHISITLVEAMDHVLNAFDKEIGRYTESKFSRQGIQLAVNTFVTDVTKDDVAFKPTQKGDEPYRRPCGMCLWSTGIAVKPLISELVGTIGSPHQTNRRALSTDGKLEVTGIPDVYAIGDCSTITPTRLLDSLTALFTAADVDQSGGLTLEEFQSFVTTNKSKFPQLEFQVAKVEEKFMKYAEGRKDQQLTPDQFGKFLREADAGCTALPCTAQVASQEGSYVGQLLNHKAKNKEEFPLFHYNHKGSFAYIGGNEAVYDMQSIQLHGGAAFWGRNAIYMTKLWSWENRKDVFFDLFWSKWFGRDVSDV